MNILDYFLAEHRFFNIVTMVILLLVAFLFSSAKRHVKPMLIVKALGLQLLLGLFTLKTTAGQAIFAALARGFASLKMFADQGAGFVFGSLASPAGPWGVVFAFNVLPSILFFGALMALLYHVGIVQLLVRSIAFVMRPLLGISGAETLCVAASSMLSQTEAPLLIKNYLAKMTDSEFFLVMVGGMAHLSGSLLAVYGSMGVPLEHLLASSVIAIPGSILIAKILVPETAVPETSGGTFKIIPAETRNVLDAVASGTNDGVRLAVGVASMLISIISLVAFIDYALTNSCGYSLNVIFGNAFYWVAYAIGIPLSECSAAGTLLGKKLVINEFVAYADFASREFAPRTQIIMTYALSGFANFSSIGIQLGGIGAVCPEKRITLTQFGLKALLGGTLVNLFNATLVGLLV